MFVKIYFNFTSNLTRVEKKRPKMNEQTEGIEGKGIKEKSIKLSFSVWRNTHESNKTLSN